MTAEREALRAALDALEEIALAGMSGSGQETEEGMRDWHAHRAWEFIGIAARALGPARAALEVPPAPSNVGVGDEPCAQCGSAGYPCDTCGRGFAAPPVEQQAASDEFRRGAKAMFDHLLIRAANNWHANPEVNAACETENKVVEAWAAEALEDVSPDDHTAWKAIGTAYAQGLADGRARAAQPPAPTEPALQAGVNQNTGHGWVHKRPDGVVARCGGPKLCKACQAEQSTAPGQPSQDAEDAARWREHVGKLDALVAFCPTCCEGKVASADMTRDEVIFQCGKTSGRIDAARADQAQGEKGGAA